MEPYIIDVSKLEELQMISDHDELERIFYRAKTTIVNGEKVMLVRKTDTAGIPFSEFSTLEELEEYRSGVFKYL